ncbi:MAG: hypothetical protein WCI72_04270 [archaeon]
MANGMVEINLKDAMEQRPKEYAAVVELIFQALFENEDKKRVGAIRTLVETLGADEVKLKQCFSGDNQIFLRASYGDTEALAYVCDHPKTYNNLPAVARNFEVLGRD